MSAEKESCVSGEAGYFLMKAEIFVLNMHCRIIHNSSINVYLESKYGQFGFHAGLVIVLVHYNNPYWWNAMFKAIGQSVLNWAYSKLA